MNMGRTTKTALGMLCVLFSAPALPCDNMQGAWELVYAIYKEEATGKVLAENKGDAEKSMKILSKEHFSFITVEKDGKFSVAAAGTYSLEPGKYIEVVTMGSMERLLGKTYRFDCKMKDGLWIHSGKEDHLLIEEHWKQVN